LVDQFRPWMEFLMSSDDLPVTFESGNDARDAFLRSVLLEFLYVLFVLTPLVWFGLHHAFLPSNQSLAEIVLVGDDPLVTWTQVWLLLLGFRGALWGVR